MLPSKVKDEQEKIEERRAILSWPVILKLVAALVFLGYFILHRDMVMVKGTYTTKSIIKILIVAIIWVVAMGFLFYRPPFGRKVDRALGIVFAVLTPVYVFLSMEIATQSYFEARFMTPVIILMNLIMIAMIEWLFIFLTNSLKWGSILCSVICIVFSVANHFVYQFRSIPILVSDFTIIKTAFSVMGNYTLVFAYAPYVSMLLLFLFIVIAGRLEETRLVKKHRYHLGGLVVMAVVIGVYVSSLTTSTFLSEQGVRLRMFRPMDSYRRYGCMVTLAQSMKYAFPETPKGYSLEAVEAIAEEYPSDAAGGDGQKPNIIVVINESFADLAVLGDFETNEDYMPFVHSLSENCVTGTTYASILGGRTANTEFEFLTNDSLAFLPSQSVPFQLYVKKETPSLITSLKDLGYVGNDAIHPWDGKNYHRDVVYPLLGFDHFYNKDNPEIPLENIRAYPSDSNSTDSIIHNYERYRKISDEPYVCYMMTVQNHSPFDKKYDNFEEEIELVDYPGEEPEVEQYLSLIKYSDQAFKELVEYFEQVDEPTIMLMMGDHQPKIPDSFLKTVTGGKSSKWNDEESMAKYAVPFVICANYDLETRTIEKTSMNYIQTILMESAGLELTGYQKFLQDMREQVPVVTGLGYYGADGNFYQLDDETSPYYEWMHKYSILQYNNLLDSKHRLDNFFYLKQ